VGAVLDATDAATGRCELWVSDGSEAGTTRVVVFASGERVAGGLTPLGGHVYLTTLGPDGTRLWKTDGTSAGTELVTAFSADVGDPGLTVSGGKLYLAGYDPAHGVELWTSDGTSAGTQRVTDVDAGAGNSWPAGLTALASALCFVTRTAAGDDLWATDGTAAGTVSLLNLYVTPPLRHRPRHPAGTSSTAACRAEEGEEGKGPGPKGEARKAPPPKKPRILRRCARLLAHLCLAATVQGVLRCWDGKHTSPQRARDRPAALRARVLLGASALLGGETEALLVRWADHDEAAVGAGTAP
jgi:ELWxxDGT repeat protein